MGLGGLIGDAFDGLDDAVKGFADVDIALTAIDAIGQGASAAWSSGIKPAAVTSWDKAIHPAYSFARHDVISPTLATIAAGPMRIDESDPHRRLSIADPRHWIANWQAAHGEDEYYVDAEGTMQHGRRGISPGQILTEGLTHRALGVRDNQPVGSTFGGEGQPAYDFMKPENRAEFYGSGFGKYMSGGLDAAAIWYTDPTVFAGRGIAAARALGVTKPLAHAGHKYGISDLDRAAFTGRSASVTEKLAAMSPQRRADVLSRMRVFRGNSAIQHLLTESKSADEMRATLRYAMDPTARNYDNLTALADDAASKVDYLRDTKIPSLEKALASAKSGESTGLGAGHWAEELNKAQGELIRTRDAMLRAESGVTAAGSLTHVPRFTLGEKAALGLKMDIYQPTRYGVATRVLKGSHMGRLRSVDLNRPGEATRAARLELDRVGHGFFTGANDPTRVAEAGAFLRRLTPEEKAARLHGSALSAHEKGALTAAVAKAETEGPEAVEKALMAVEERIFGWYATKLGISTEDARGIMEAAWEKRQQTLASLGGGKGKVYSAATNPATGGRLDHVIIETGEPGVMTSMSRPLAVSQFSNRLPMLDVDEMAKVLQRHKAVSEDPAEWAKLMGMLRNGASEGSGLAAEAADNFNRIWKPLQLLRVGWPIRVITDENFRIMATVGALVHLPLQAQSIFHSAKETRLAYRARDVITAGARAEARDTVHTLTPLAHQQKMNQGIVAHIGEIDSEISTMDVQIRELGEQLDQAAAHRDAARVSREGPANTRAQTGGRGVRYSTQNPATVPGPGRAVYSYRVDDTASVLNTTAHDPDPGVAALRTLISPGEFDTLNGMPLAQLRKVIARDGVDNAAQYRSREDLLSAYGAHKARAAGHGAIHHAPTQAPTPKLFDTTTERLSQDDVRLLATRIGHDLPPASRGGMTVPQLRTFLGADANPATARTFDAAVRKMLKTRGYEGVKAAPAKLDLATAELSSSQVSKLATSLGEAAPTGAQAMSPQMLRTYWGIKPGTARAKRLDSEARRLLGVEAKLEGRAPREPSVELFGKAPGTAVPAPSLTALTDDVLREVPADAEVRALAKELNQKLVARNQRSVDRKVLTGRSAVTPEWTQDMWESWAAIMTKAEHKPSDVRRLNGPARKFSGKIEVTRANGTVQLIDDVYGGDYGAVPHSLVSSQDTMRSLAGLQDRNLNGLRLEAGESAVLHPVAPEGVHGPNKDLYETSYKNAWVLDVNDQIGKDQLMRRILQGQSDEEIIAWLKGTREGRQFRRTSESIHRGDVKQWVEHSRVHVDHYLSPEVPALREAALKGEASFKMLEDTYPNPADRPDLHGESLRVTTGRSRIARRWNQTVNGMYKAMGSLPTDALSRHPYAAALYRKSMTGQIDSWGDAALSTEVIDRMQGKAREVAIAGVRNTLYDLTRETHLGHAMRFIAPFYNAWADALTTWGRLFMEDPTRLAHLSQVWEAPSKAGMVQTDPTSGKQYIVTNLPSELHQWAGVTQMGIPKYWTRDLIMSPEYGYLPGAGPVVAVPIGEWARRRPDDAGLLKPLIPFGAGEGALDQMIPRHFKNLLAKGHKSYDNVEYARALNMNTQVLLSEQAEGRINLDPTQMAAEAERRTDNLMTLKLASSFLMPFSSNFRSPYQFYMDQHRALQAEWTKKYPNGRDERGRTSDEEFIDRFGQDYFAFTQSAAASNVGGIAPTVGGYKAYQKYDDLIGAHPDLGGLIVGEEDEGAFSADVYRYQRTHRVGPGDSRMQREIGDPKEIIQKNQISQGWDLYRQVNTAVDADLHRLGLRTITQNGAEYLRAYKTLAVKQIVTKYPLWAEAYDTFSKGGSDRLIAQVESFIDDPRFAGRDGWGTFAEYLSARRTIVAELDRRAATGGSATMSARSNDDLRVTWSMVKSQLTERDLAFADIHSRWLDNDNLVTRATVAP